jgi:response regulator RpfG family c-di-GMP phosphodiesterase
MRALKPKIPSGAHQNTSLRPWKVALIDGEQQVHEVIQKVLKSTLIDDQPLQFLTAHSAEDGLRLFQIHSDIALAFINVVLESDNAGLELIHHIRNDLHNHATRIVLHTGQPGTVPEEPVIRMYDINDYKSKEELTDTKIKTCVYSAIRSYRDIFTIEASKRGMQNVIAASNSVLRSHSLHQFGKAIISHTVQLFNIKTAEIYLVSQHVDLFGDTELMLLAATTDYVKYNTKWDTAILPTEVKNAILTTFHNQQPSVTNEIFIGYYQTNKNTQSVLYARFHEAHSVKQDETLKLFAANIALIFQNLHSREHIQQTQKELLLVLGNAIEKSSKETGSHVRRVALMCELLALKLGHSSEYAEILRHAAPLHDIGKIGIPEAILHKPGKLDDDEWEIMKTHAQIGYDLLKKSTRTIAKMGARIALSHHEHWDGNGYPNGLRGEAIPLEGRIVAIIDVIDALASERTYKKPWLEDDIVSYITENRDKQFDPAIVDAALSLLDSFRVIRRNIPDHFFIDAAQLYVENTF